jgi:glycosyltransferase involved in cell wall biosynthesis
MLSQTYENFELILVDDGSFENTKVIIKEYSYDKRLIHVEQTNSGLSTSRNRGISMAKGKYICFLDGDDLRPIWSLQKIYEIANTYEPDCIFTKGKFVPPSLRTIDFHDEDVFKVLNTVFSDKILFLEKNNKDFDNVSSYLPLIAPQSANKIIKKDYMDRYQLKFPDGMIFEDMLFHSGVITHLNSFAVLTLPCFTYFTRYEHKQITAINTMKRLDSVSVALISLEKFAQTEMFNNINMRMSLLVSLFYHLSWNKSSISLLFKNDFDDSIKFLLKKINKDYFKDYFSDDFYKTLSNIEWMVNMAFSFLLDYSDEIDELNKEFLKFSKSI